MNKRVKGHIDRVLSPMKGTDTVFTTEDVMERLRLQGYTYIPTSRELGQYLKGKAVSLGCRYTAEGYVSLWKMA